MSCLGELPLLDAAVFADTQWEPAEVYTHLDWLTEYAGKAGIPVYRVSQGNLRSDAIVSQVRGVKTAGQRWASMPLFTKQVIPFDSMKVVEAVEDDEDASWTWGQPVLSGGVYVRIGMIRRQCTSEYKIKPLDRFIKRTLLGIEPGRRAPENAVETWVGISADEARRRRKRLHRWQTLRYPLIEDVRGYGRGGLFVEGFTRNDCLIWLDRNKFPRAPRSACIGCPYHSDEEWLRIKADPVQWEDACQFDEAIRNCGGMRGQVFLHRSCVPLREVVFNPSKRWDGVAENECAGICGV